MHPPPRSVSATQDGASPGPPVPCRVLVVEDDATIAGNLHAYLSRHGFDVDLAHDGAAAIARLDAHRFDVLVVDLGLPRVGGMQVIDHLRRALGHPTPVLVLTARDTLGDKLDAFGIGADDYLVKPFALAEVAARLLALHRRARREVATDRLECGPLRLDRRLHEAWVGDRPLRLARMSMRLLDRLMRDPGRLVSRAELEAALWPDDLPQGDPLRSQVHLLRRALQAAGYDGLETVPGVGWRLDDRVRP